MLCLFLMLLDVFPLITSQLRNYKYAQTFVRIVDTFINGKKILYV